MNLKTMKKERDAWPCLSYYFQHATFIASCWLICLSTVPISSWRIRLVDSVCFGCLKRQATPAWFTSTRGMYPCLDQDPVFLSAGAKMLHWTMDLFKLQFNPRLMSGCPCNEEMHGLALLLIEKVFQLIVCPLEGLQKLPQLVMFHTRRAGYWV